MQRGKATARFCVVVVAAVVEEATLATPAGFPPPQAARSSEKAAATTTAVEARMSGRRQRMVGPFTERWNCCRAALSCACSYGSQRLGGRHAGGADCGEQSGDRPDDDGRGEAAGPGGCRDDDRPVLGRGVDRGRNCPCCDAHRAAEDGE